MAPDPRRAARLLRDAAIDMDRLGAHDRASECRDRAALAEATADVELAQYLGKV